MMDTVKNARNGQILWLNPNVKNNSTNIVCNWDLFTKCRKKFVPVVSTNSVSLWQSR